jgi:hypothetical protein
MNVAAVRADFSSLPSVVKRMFGKWSKIYDILGIKPPRQGIQWTRQKVISEMRRIYQLPLSVRANQLEYLWRVALRYFPSRAVIYEKFGFPGRNIWSRPRIIKYLQNRVRKHQPISTIIILRENRFVYRAARYHFGSYQKAIEAAGFDYKPGVRGAPGFVE